MRLLIAVLIALSSIACSRYDYPSNHAGMPIRVDRISGETQVLTANKGWIPLKQPAPIVPATLPSVSTVSTAPCTEEEFKAALADSEAMRYAKYLPRDANFTRLDFCRQRLIALSN